MLTDEIRSKVDLAWNAFWAGSIVNPLEVIEQITSLLFMRGLDHIKTREENTGDLLSIVKMKKTKLLFLKLRKPGGGIMPDGALFSSSTAHKAIRKMLVDDHQLDAIVKLLSGVFRPYAALPPRSSSSPRPIPAARITSGSTICRPTA